MQVSPRGTGAYRCESSSASGKRRSGRAERSIGPWLFRVSARPLLCGHRRTRLTLRNASQSSRKALQRFFSRCGALDPLSRQCPSTEPAINLEREPDIPVGFNPAFVAFVDRKHAPTNVNQCRNDGWKDFSDPSFNNQGDCISFVNH